MSLMFTALIHPMPLVTRLITEIHVTYWECEYYTRDLPSRHSSSIFRVTSELTLQVVLYQMVMLCEGDEWVTSGLK